MGARWAHERGEERGCFGGSRNTHTHTHTLSLSCSPSFSQVILADVIALRDSIVMSDGDMRKPSALFKKMRSFNCDSDVNRSLLMMLSVPEDMGDDVRESKRRGRG